MTFVIKKEKVENAMNLESIFIIKITQNVYVLQKSDSVLGPTVV